MQILGLQISLTVCFVPQTDAKPSIKPHTDPYLTDFPLISS